ncbi:ABC transporter ATP-binding protein [Peloplasma aerotolerans]|jgi:ATP-binding cassette, subfamily B, multidrug efflux pump|uniref:ABC transporter ATP-binding protein n=1 Tax=Peloplasma aerotolerans TaxID=3044389 RepID=A0AAW6U999_9MOLU|nr:ABC transporter ATP-binding protein [Mariniplasma sp. M4Ah]MDI6452636.1 ABC transporter ATP-binding protein [Mariniplasma sp. M4Ah]
MLLGKHFRKYYLKYSLFFLLGASVLIVVDWYQLDIPRLVGGIIDTLNSTNPDVDAVEAAIIRIAVLAGIITVGRFIWRYTIFGASRRIEYQLRNTMFGHATKLSQSFYNQEKVGGLMAHFINDLEAVRMSYGPGILMLIDGLTLGIFAVYRMARLNPRLTFYAAVPMVILTILLVFIRRTISARFKERQESFEKLSDFTQENFSGITVIKAFVREMKEAMFFSRRNLDLYDKHIKFIKFIIIINIAVGVALNVVILFIVVLGSLLVINRDATGMTAGQLTEYLSYFFALIWPTMALSQFIQIHSQAKGSAQRIAKFLDHEIDVRDHEDVEYVEDLKGSIQVKDLTFKYPDGDSPVLKNVSFDINAGEMVGILGRTGSGKSSLVDLLLKIYNLDHNRIFIDGHDIMRLSVKSVRNTIGYVPQDNFLFSETIIDNIGFSMEHPTEEDVIESAKLADVYDNVMEFKEKFGTILGERGVTVSGGQKQRISIARALAKNPEILILDDSVSAVDTKTEEAIIKNLHRIRKGKTTIFIAHRISTVRKMDKIILFDQGEVVAIGNHAQLMKTSPLYQDMVKRQTLENLVQGGAVNEGLQG